MLGAHIEEIGSNTLHIHGVTKLHGGEFTIGPDYLEVISFVGAAAVTHGTVRVKNAGVKNLGMIAHVFERLGVKWNEEGDDLIVPADQSLKSCRTWMGRSRKSKPMSGRRSQPI